jgi:secondary thiamine-phosphate synthase enzyme
MVHAEELELETTADTDIVDVSDKVAEIVARSGVSIGQVLVFTPGSTAAVTTIEYESGVVEDLRAAIERVAPQDMDYLHDRRWGDGNGYSHVRAALMGASFCAPVQGGRALLGTWQQIVVLDFDNRPRRRRVIVQVSGE